MFQATREVTATTDPRACPFRTIARALQTLHAGETIHIAAGFYNETITLFGDSDNVTIIGDFDTQRHNR